MLLKTLFSPWRKYEWSPGKGFDINRYLDAFFSNLISRALGFIIRIVLILVGISVEIFIFFGGLIIIIIWLLLPILLIGGIYFGLKQILI
ncbi:hypothetical protein ACFL0A_00710 [Patescibacteria group bacterium]